MRALVTGGCGLIGSHIVDQLLARGDDVTIIDNLEPVSHPNGLPAWTREQMLRGVRFIEGDILNLDDLDRAAARCEVIFHQAAGVGFSPESEKTRQVNVVGTINAINVARGRIGCRKVVLASSQAVYGPRGDRSTDDLDRGLWDAGALPAAPVAEDAKRDARTPYAISKLVAEEAALALGVYYGLPVVALRYALTYGPRQSLSNPYTGICSMFSTRILHDQPVTLYEDGKQVRDFTYVSDVAAANLLVADDPRADGQAFNVGTGVATEIELFAQVLANAYGKTGYAKVTGMYRPGDARHLVTDGRKLRALGWHPKVTLDGGVQRYADWILSGPVPESRSEEAERELLAAEIIRVGGL